MTDRTKSRTLQGSRHEKAERSLGFLFWKCFNHWSRQIRVELEAQDLTQVQYSILAAIGYLTSSERLVSQQDIANQLSMDKMMVSDVVKTLERKKLITRKRSPEDRRSFSLHLTPEARRRLKNAVPTVESADERFFESLTPEELRMFASCLKKLAPQNQSSAVP